MLAQKEFTSDYLTHKLKANKGELPMYRISSHHKAIIDHGLFDKVQKIREKNRKSYGRKRGETRAYSKLLVCGECGRYFNYKNSYWFCPSSELIKGKCLCHAERIEEKQVEKMLEKAFEIRFENFDCFEILKNDDLESEFLFNQKQRKALELSIENKRKKVSFLTTKKESYETRKNLLDDQSVTNEMIKDWENEIQEISLQINMDISEKEKIQNLIESDTQYRNELEENSDLRERAEKWLETVNDKEEFFKGAAGEYCKAFVLSVTVFSHDNFRVHWFDNTFTEIK